jgi:hypothetical protein
VFWTRHRLNLLPPSMSLQAPIWGWESTFVLGHSFWSRSSWVSSLEISFWGRFFIKRPLRSPLGRRLCERFFSTVLRTWKRFRARFGGDKNKPARARKGEPKKIPYFFSWSYLESKRKKSKDESIKRHGPGGVGSGQGVTLRITAIRLSMNSKNCFYDSRSVIWKFSLILLQEPWTNYFLSSRCSLCRMHCWALLLNPS